MLEYAKGDLGAAEQKDVKTSESAELSRLPADVWRKDQPELPSDTWKNTKENLPPDYWKKESYGQLDAMEPREIQKQEAFSGEEMRSASLQEIDQRQDAKDIPEYFSSYKQRLDQTPTERFGQWTGERGESQFIPNNPEMKNTLEKFGLDGIKYEAAIPDFSRLAASTVQIDMVAHRENKNGEIGNFQQCDEKCAENWNTEARDGRTDWTARDIQNWREENGYTWHERNDVKTCDLIPTSVNAYFGHFGGVGECRIRDGALETKGGGFDD